MAPRTTEHVVVVTGASSGVGRAVARAFGARRAKVALLARNVDALAVAAEEIRQLGGDALVLPVDVADADAVERAAAAVEERWVSITMVYPHLGENFTKVIPHGFHHDNSPGVTPR